MSIIYDGRDIFKVFNQIFHKIISKFVA